MIKRLINHIKKEQVDEESEVKDIKPKNKNDDIYHRDIDAELKAASREQEEQRRVHDPKEIILEDAISKKEEVINLKNNFSIFDEHNRNNNSNQDDEEEIKSNRPKHNIDVVDMNERNQERYEQYDYNYSNKSMDLEFKKEIEEIKRENYELLKRNNRLNETIQK